MFLKYFTKNRLLTKLGRKFTHSFSTHEKERQITIAGQSINYFKVGNGNHTLLCLPGAIGTVWSDFKPQIDNLCKDKFTIVAWDPPGYGSSRPPERKFTKRFYEDDADLAYEFMKTLQISKFSMLGWSDGGNTGMILAAKYPLAVKKLVIWGANSYVSSEDIEIYKGLTNIKNWSDKMKAPLIALYGEEKLQLMWTNWYNVLKDIYDECEGDICKDKLRLIQSPTLILHGDKDPVVPSIHPNYLKQNIKGALLHRFPEGKHNIHLRYSKEFNELVTKFLEEHYKAKL